MFSSITPLYMACDNFFASKHKVNPDQCSMISLKGSRQNMSATENRDCLPNYGHKTMRRMLDKYWFLLFKLFNDTLKCSTANTLKVLANKLYLNELIPHQLSLTSDLWHVKCMYVNPLTPMSDQDRIPPYNCNTISTR